VRFSRKKVGAWKRIGVENDTHCAANGWRERERAY